METQRLLLIDDDAELAAMLAEYLRLDGFEVDIAHTAEDGVRAAVGPRTGTERHDPPALVILDVMLPDGSGVDALRRIRAESSLPVLMLTARGDPVDRVVGLEVGADDYVPKPCLPRELVARVRAILRRTAARPATSAPISAGALQLWPQRRRVAWQGTLIPLTSAEFELFEQLLSHAGDVVSKADLSQRALGRPLARFDRSIDVHISSIRQKLGARPDGQSWIQSVRGKGYQLLEE